MTKNRALRALALAAGLLAPTALAATETPAFNTPYVFATVDDYSIVNLNTVDITGILQGESAPRTFRFYLSSSTDSSQHMSRCDRLALLAMTRPGRYLLEMAQGTGGTLQTRCKLTRQ